MKKQKLKRNKGITLIALVVTIIVLLILAGISIQMLVGEGGILTNAREAARKTNQADAKERIELEVAETLLENKELTVEGLNKHLAAHIPEITHEGKSLTENPINELPTIVELDGFVFQIDEYGKVTAIDGIALSKSDLELQILTHNEETTNGSETLTATLIGISGNISWNTEGKDVIGVETTDGGKSATITAKQEGTEKVIVTCSGRTAECKVMVKNVEAVTSITLDPTTTTITEGDELEITAEVEGTEDLTWDWKNTSGETSLTITPSGEGKTKCTVVAQGAGKATVTASAKYAEATCTITVTSPYIDNSYVQYDVEYTDVDTGTTYTKNTGWRVMADLTSYEDKGEYTGPIDIISTGIPAELFYDGYSIKDASWLGSEEQYAQFKKDYYGNDDYTNVYAAAGLLYNFNEILFDCTSSSNTGRYEMIKTNKIYQEPAKKPTGEDLFTDQDVKEKIAEIRSVNLKDLTGSSLQNDDWITENKTGLFRLKNYTPDIHERG